MKTSGAFPPGIATLAIRPPPEAVLTAFALIQHEHHGIELPVSLLHRGEHVEQTRQQLQDLVADLLAAGAQAGRIRADVAPGELASYCLHARHPSHVAGLE